MRVLLLHPEDGFPASSSGTWDLIVDFARAPAATYARWTPQAGCRVVSLFDFARGFDDLYRLRDLVQLGAGSVVDRQGIDWWDVVSPLIIPDLERAVMMLRLAEELGDSPQLYATRPDLRANALKNFLNCECRNLQATGLGRTLRHYGEVWSRFNFRQLFQISQDKFDPEHALRRRLARRRRSDGRPLYLLPSAYINVSRTAVAYAALLPQENFLLVTTRRDGCLHELPTNVQMTSLDGYFGPLDGAVVSSLLMKLSSIRTRLVSEVPEFRMADYLGMFDRMPGLMRWGLAARDAWKRVFESENIVGCLSADEANPYTSIPLYLAQQRGIPALGVHHGALDYRMAVKTLHADPYLAKGELERDYLVRQCRVAPHRIAVGSPGVPSPAANVSADEKPWLVFFTEPYGTSGWRMEEVYRDLLPRLLSLAQITGLTLVFKLHPFESSKGHRSLLRKFLAPGELDKILVIAGPAPAELWAKTRFAMTVESTIALECAALGVPVFLCGWLQSSHCGYVAQYARFGIGELLDCSEQIAEIPTLLTRTPARADLTRVWQKIDTREFRSLLTAISQTDTRALA